MAKAFDLLTPGVQRWLYQQRWTELRPIQVEAIESILTRPGDLIIAARTASGKTEAAFLPILSAIAGDFSGSVRALYIGPLRALINDQFRRMELLCADLGVPVHKWHGEVGQADRRAVLQDPAGVLLITPESLEAFFARRASSIESVFGRLDFVVIDELHVFPGTERGMHLRSLLNRLERRCDRSMRRIGLSATLGDLERYKQWLRPTHPDAVELINHPREGAELKTRCYAFHEVSAPTEPGDDGRGSSSTPLLNAADAQPTNPAVELATAVWKHHRRGVNLVFANSKRRLEEMTASLQEVGRSEGVTSERILIHHGSLSRDSREEVEALLQTGSDRICCCSSTLELGVDIGSVTAVAHLDAPWSVASLAQRLGRSGRREGEAAVFRQYHALKSLAGLDPLDEEHLRPDLVRGVTLMTLYLEGWCETPDMNRSHASTLVHQIISTIAETGGVTASHLFDRLIGGNGFAPISQPTFARLLRHLGHQQVIEQISDGTLLLGAAGERELEDKGFFAAFLAVDAYEVIHGNRRIGSISIDNVYQLGDGFRLGGRGWEVEDLDKEKLRIYVVPSSKRNLPQFSGQRGIIHDRVIMRAFDLLRAEDQIGFLDPVAGEGLASARDYFDRYGLDKHRMLASDGGVILFPWRGTRVMETLQWMLRGSSCTFTTGILTIHVERQTEQSMTAVLRKSVGRLRSIVNEGVSDVPVEMLWREKFDKYAPSEMLVDSIVADRLDLPGTDLVIREFLLATDGAGIDTDDGEIQGSHS